MDTERDELVGANQVPEEPSDLLHALPGVARIYATALWHTAEWTVEASLRASSRVARAAVTGESPAVLLEEAGEDLRDYARRLLGIVDAEGRVHDAVSDLMAARRPSGGRDSSAAALRERGAELLRRSADVHDRDDTHPAYQRILSELTPDEGRILRLLAREGPQPAIDVRKGWLPLGIGSELVAPGLTMIGAHAGCRYMDRVSSYLHNLYRLGLIWFSRESLGDPLRYQVLEAQPVVLAAIKEAGHAQTVRRSIHLTPFGADFCELCLPLDVTGEFEAVAPVESEPAVSDQ